MCSSPRCSPQRAARTAARRAAPEARQLPSTARELERALAEDLAWASSELGARIVEASPVSPLRGRNRPRGAFRLTLADGRRLKLRRMRSPARAAQLARLLARLRDLGLPQAVLRRGPALVVEWIDGAPLAPGRVPPERCEEAGRLLAGIHTTDDFDGRALPRLGPTRGELRQMRDELAALVSAKRLAADGAERLAAAARALAPRRALCGVVHGDFCAENFVVDRSGRLRVVDNEALEIGPFARDLARVAARWPMPPQDWRRFLAAYRSAGGARSGDDELALWEIRTLVRSGWYRVAHRLIGVEEALARLRTLSERL